MNEKTAALISRIRRLQRECQALATAVTPGTSGQRLHRRLAASTTGLNASYEAASAAGSRESFIVHISAAARHAKRARQLLQDLTQTHHPEIDRSRDLILEARGIEAILSASRNTARTRRARRVAEAGGRFAQNPFGARRQA